MSAVKKMMFNKKRKRKQPSDENLDKPQEIKKKRDDFTEIEFKLMLRDSNKIFEGEQPSNFQSQVRSLIDLMI